MSQAKATTMTEEASLSITSSFSELPPAAEDTLITTEPSPKKNIKEPVLTVTPADDETASSSMMANSSSTTTVSSPEEMGISSPSSGGGSGVPAAATTTTVSNGNGNMRVTRSQSYESGSQQDTPEPTAATSTTLMTRKRTRRGASSPGATGSSNKRIKNGPMRGVDDNRETRHTHQRMTKEAREARRAQREAESKERLAELDALEAAVKNGTHPEYIRLLQEIEHKRTSKISITKAHFTHAVANQKAVMTAATKAAHDNFQLQKQGLRRQMIQHVQQQISSLEQEYYSHNVTDSLDSDHLSEWTPRHRPSRLDSIVVPLTEDEAELDFSQMWTAVAQQQQQQQTSHNHHHGLSSSPRQDHETHAAETPPAATSSHSPLALRHQPPSSYPLRSSNAQTTSLFSTIPPLSKEASSASSNARHSSPSSITLDEFPPLADRAYYSGPPSLIDHRPPPSSSPTNQLVK